MMFPPLSAGFCLETQFEPFSVVSTDGRVSRIVAELVFQLRFDVTVSVLALADGRRTNDAGLTAD
jgi:hypothetical protein